METQLILAKEDLESAKLLYKNKKYSNALYHYHQCVEKAGKYIGLAIGSISEAQLTEISHDPIKVFKLLFKHFSKQSNGFLPPIDPHLFTNAKQIIDSGSEEEIVRSARNIITSIMKEEKIINEEKFTSPFDAVVDYIHKTIPEFNLGLDDELLKQYATVRLKDQTNDLIIFINYGLKILHILLINSLICSKFKPDEFRYPSDSLGNPAEYFDEKNALIRDLQFFINSMNITIEFALKINWKHIPI